MRTALRPDVGSEKRDSIKLVSDMELELKLRAVNQQCELHRISLTSHQANIRGYFMTQGLTHFFSCSK